MGQSSDVLALSIYHIREEMLESEEKRLAM